MMRDIDIKQFLLMPIECTTETDKIFIFNGRIYSSQKYRGMDPDMSDLAIRFYEIIYGRSLLAGAKLQDKQFCGDTMNSSYSAKSYGIKGDELKKWESNHRCLANFWLLPMPIGHTSPNMTYEVGKDKYTYKELIMYSKSNPKNRDNMYLFLESIIDYKNDLYKLFPKYWNHFGDGYDFKKSHFLGAIYDIIPKKIDYETARNNICRRAEIILKDKIIRNELSELLDSIEH